MKIKPKVMKAITRTIIEGLETNGTWVKSWACGLPQNYITKKAYRGMNLILTSMKGYDSPYWLGMKQVNTKGGKVKKGERATWILTPLIQKRKDKDGKEQTFLYGFGACKIWNIEQTTLEVPENVEREIKPITRCVEIVEGYENSPAIIHEGVQACYNPSTDEVCMPKPQTFPNEEKYYKTLFHELSHSTGHKKRLDRELKGKYDKVSYSFEELVAEMGSLFLCAEAGIDMNTKNSQAYINGWITYLKNNEEAIIKASSKAQKSCDLIVGGE